MLIGEALWQQLYSRDPQVVGRTIRIDDAQQTIIGVVPSTADFGTLQVLSAADYGKGFAARGGRCGLTSGRRCARTPRVIRAKLIRSLSWAALPERRASEPRNKR